MKSLVECNIHATAVIDPTAEMHETAKIGPYCIVGPGCEIGPEVILHPRVTLIGRTKIGARTQVFPGACLGGDPQDRKFGGEESWLIVGEDCLIREFVTIHRSTGGGQGTVIGPDTMVMAYSHIGHNCRIGRGVTLANNAGVSGYVTIEDYANIGGYVGLHQYVRVGTMSLVGGMSKVVRDVPPYFIVDGRPAAPRAVNNVGLRRHDVPADTREGLKMAYRLLYRSSLPIYGALERIQAEVQPTPERDHLVEFLSEIRGGFSGRARDPRGACP